MLKLVALAASLVFSSAAVAQDTYIVSPNGQYLGELNSNQYDPNSVSSPYGRYGSRYSSDSINNPYGQYGSQYSNDSARNPYATNPPLIIRRNRY